MSISNKDKQALICVSSYLKGNFSKQPSSYIDLYKLESLEKISLLKKIHLQGKIPLLSVKPKTKGPLQDKLEFIDFHYFQGKADPSPVLLGILKESRNFISFEYQGKQL